jgi:site-specific recombinase XerD
LVSSGSQARATAQSFGTDAELELSVLIFGGLRRQELLDLRAADVNVDEGSILVRAGKGMKSRTVYVCDECAAAIRDWLAIRPQAPIPDLFAYDTKRHLHFNGLKAIMEETKARAGYADREYIAPHSLRQAAATRQLS